MSRTDRMASDLSRTGPVERDIEQAITALKKGAYLLKYGRRGKPKFCPFRLANDESVLIWFSGKEEKHLKLSHVSKIISGQRTPIFQRYPRPEKEYQSFSLIYNDRSLDLICKDKEEAEQWFSGLKALISRSHHRKWRTESRSDGIPSEANSPRTYTRRSSPLHSPFGSGDSLQKGGSDSVHGQMKAMTMDAFRVSLSSAVSSSSQGSGHDDGDALGDVFIWGECTADGVLGGGNHKVGSFGGKMDSLLPKALESAVVLDVQNIACGGRHAALVTKQGEIFSWGEESGGRLGHGVDSDVLQPKLIDALSNTNIELVACGEYHTCAVTLSGDLYTWGDGTYNFGLLGHGNEVSHWVPKRVNGPLEGIHVSYISCGPWHTAVVTSAGQLFTFGDGTFGVLGHGDRRSVSKPREVESLKGLRTVRAACGVWHTAAVVEVMVGNSSSSNCSSGKLFTWGDGEKGRLGHGDKEAKLVPTCVAALVEPNFCQVACGHSLTVALTTSGHVYTMGSPNYGQLGNPQVDGKLPTRVEGKLSKSFVEEIACGAYHVAVLTSRTEVYTWGKGANGRLGHGDTDDKHSPSLLKDMAERLPVGASRSSKSPPFTSFGSNPASSDISIASIDRLNGQITCQEPDSNGSNSQLFSNGSSTTSNRSSGHNRIGNSEATIRNGSRTKEGDSESCIDLFQRMNEEGIKPTLTTLSSLLMACSRSAKLEHGKFLHGYIMRNGIEADIFIYSSLIDLYFKCGCVRLAENVFGGMAKTNAVSWNVMISGYVTVGCYFEALGIFSDMKEAGVKPDAVTFTSILPACSQLAALEKGKEIHNCIIESKFESNEIVMGALLDMYAKCGAVDEALHVFNQLPERDFVSWTSMITAYGSHGHAFEALKLFSDMQQSSAKPDKVTFLAVMSACGHAGLVDEGYYYFNQMTMVYGIKPTVEHYSCLMDLLGRAGRLHEAYEILQRTPGIREDVGLLSTLFSACHLHRELELGEEIARLLIEKDPNDHSTYIILSHIYASVNKWDEVRKVRLQMKKLGLKKNPGCSWIEIDKKIQSFFVEDKSHPQTEMVYECLAILTSHMEKDKLLSH
ncbi:hypothetical protein L1049_018581 [Liquidambar formosana]|uniref:PH domain-containing protein n=1 Tax=Liquidambar formosana TaxID=63359 RepID=A0AAP0RAA3_LIQFO